MDIDKKKICWITADYFLDVDINIVPYLSNYYQIDWFILCGSFTIKNDKLIDICIDKSINLLFIEINNPFFSPISFIEYRNIFKQVNKLKPEFVYIDLGFMPFSLLAADLMLNKRNVVVATHNVTTPKGARLEHLARLNMFYLLRRFRNFHIFSLNQKKSLESKVIGKKVLFAPLALKDYGTLPTNVKDSKVNFLSFGHIRNYKRIDLLILAAQQVFEETGILFKVTIAGSCNEWPKYQQLIHYPELFDLRVGFIKDDDIPLLIAKCNYLVLPYQDLAQSGAITVAFNYNMPVICSDLPQFKEVVSDGINGYLFRSESVEDLKMVLVKCLNLSIPDYQDMCKCTKQYVFENYAIESIGQRYIEFFSKLNCTA